MLSRIFKAPEQSFFLLGPRGSGKSTWLRATFPDAHVLDLLAEETYQRLLANPGLFAAELRALTSNRWVIIDEVQRLSNAFGCLPMKPNSVCASANCPNGIGTTPVSCKL